MKDDRRGGCGCGRPAPRPAERPSPCCSRPQDRAGCAPPQPCGEYLMQRILASGRVYRRRACYPVSLNALPEQAQPPFTVLEAASCYAPCWEEAPCRDRWGKTLLVTIPLECWRGQPMVQAAVRLAGRPCPCDCTRCNVPLEVCIEGYLIAPCAVGRPEPTCCPHPLPWYPEPIYDPYH